MLGKSTFPVSQQKMLLLSIFVFFAIFDASLCFGQEEEENKIREAIENMEGSHPYRLGIFRVQPRLIVDSGYDSNALVSSLEEFGDYYASIAPGGGFAVKMGRRGYIEFSEDLTFLYYRDLEQLRDIYNSSALKLVTGSRRFLIEFGGGYLSKKAPINSEFDVPADQKSTTVYNTVTFGLKSSTDLILGTSYAKNNYEQLEDVPDPILPPSDNKTWSYSLGLQHKIKEWLTYKLDTMKGTTEFRNQVEAGEDDKSKTFRITTGFTFLSKRIIGSAEAGIDRLDKPGQEEPSKDFITKAAIDFLLGKSTKFGFFVTRERRISAFLPNDFSLATEMGVQASIPLFRKLFLEGSFMYGTNEYNDEAVVEGEVVRKDIFKVTTALLKYDLIGDLFIHGGVQNYTRDSNIDILTKDRFVYLVGVTYDPFAEH